MKRFCAPYNIYLVLLLSAFGTARAQDSTLSVMGRTYAISRQHGGEDKNVLVIYEDDVSVLRDTIAGSGFAGIRYTDFNKDGMVDLMVVYGGSDPYAHLYLFDRTGAAFRHVLDYEKYPQALPVENYQGYYYSFRKTGCGGENWTSDLFCIRNFRVVHLARIDGTGCSEDLSTRQARAIQIFKTNQLGNAAPRLYRKLSYDRRVGHFCDKWRFIKNYWEEHWHKFPVTSFLIDYPGK